MRTPEIDYPCRWTYRVIGRGEAPIRARIAHVVGDRAHTLAPSQTSAAGRYVSLVLELEVRDASDRDRIFADLLADPAIVTIL